MRSYSRANEDVSTGIVHSSARDLPPTLLDRIRPVQPERDDPVCVELQHEAAGWPCRSRVHRPNRSQEETYNCRSMHSAASGVAWLAGDRDTAQPAWECRAALTALVTMPNGSSTRATPVSRSGFISGNVITSS